MESQEITFEQLAANRFTLQTEYDVIKTHLLQKINRMEAIENEIRQIDAELIIRNQSKK